MGGDSRSYRTVQEKVESRRRWERGEKGVKVSKRALSISHRLALQYSKTLVMNNKITVPQTYLKVAFTLVTYPLP